MRPYEISFRIFFQEEYENFRVKMYHNVNQLQWKLESKNLHSSNPKTYLDVLRTPFKKFFDSSSDNESSSAGNDPNANIGPSYNSNTVSEVHHDLFENMSVHGIQNHDLPESIPDTYVVNENNSNIMSDIPNMDPDREKAEHDYVDDEQQRAYSTS
ncbi:hypothetical protein Tco_0349589 [Tanacetum coccineum]